jgi:hypothetical protein
MALLQKKQEVLEYWNSKKITVHRAMLPGLSKELDKILKYLSVDDLKASIDFYAEILEVGTPEPQKRYFWTHKWNLQEFLKRGVEKFDGQQAENYLRRVNLDSPSAIVFKRNK